jgi:hypothetical protein
MFKVWRAGLAPRRSPLAQMNYIVGLHILLPDRRHPGAPSGPAVRATLTAEQLTFQLASAGSGSLADAVADARPATAPRDQWPTRLANL